MKTASASKNSTIKNILNSAAFLPLVFFITSVSLWGAFISKVYYEDQTTHIIDSFSDSVLTAKQAIRNDKQASSLNSKRIEALTKELKEQRQRNALLKIQIEESQSKFKVMIDQSVASASASDKEYLKDLDADISNKLENTDFKKVNYFNRVEVNPDTYKNSGLQQKIYQLLPISPDEIYSTYMQAISFESEI